MSNPPFQRRGFREPQIRINGRIRAREVRVIGPDGQQIGLLSLRDAIARAESYGVDLVEIVPNADPPVCKIVDFGKYQYDLSKKKKETKKHQHSNKLKEIQLSPVIDHHDFEFKLHRAIDFLCEEMKVKVSLRFKGRQMAHKEVGFGVMDKFIRDIGQWGVSDAPPKLVGRAINVMVSPLPATKRAANPNPNHRKEPAASEAKAEGHKDRASKRVPTDTAENPSGNFQNSPFENLDSRISS